MYNDKRVQKNEDMTMSSFIFSFTGLDFTNIFTYFYSNDIVPQRYTVQSFIKLDIFGSKILVFVN